MNGAPMQANLFLYPAGCNDLLQLLTDRPVVEFAEYELIFLQVLVTVDNLQGYIHQFHLIGYGGTIGAHHRLVAMRNNPLIAVDVHNVIGSQVLHVHECQCRPTNKHEDVTYEGKVGILKLMGHHLLQFLFCQKFTLLAVWADMVIDFVALARQEPHWE